MLTRSTPSASGREVETVPSVERERKQKGLKGYTPQLTGKYAKA